MSRRHRHDCLLWGRSRPTAHRLPPRGTDRLAAGAASCGAARSPPVGTACDVAPVPDDGASWYFRRSAYNRWALHDRREVKPSPLCGDGQHMWCGTSRRSLPVAAGKGRDRGHGDHSERVGNRSPNPPSAGLAQAMCSTAQSAKKEAVDRCREDEKAYVEQLQARSSDHLGSFQSAAEADVVTLQQDAKARLEGVRLETEARITRRRELLQQALAESDFSIRRPRRFRSAWLRSRTSWLASARGCTRRPIRRFSPTWPRGCRTPQTSSVSSTRKVPRRSNSTVGRAAWRHMRARSQPRPPRSADRPVQAAAAPPVKPVRIPLLPGTRPAAGAVRGRLFSEAVRRGRAAQGGRRRGQRRPAAPRHGPWC